MPRSVIAQLLDDQAHEYEANVLDYNPLHEECVKAIEFYAHRDGYDPKPAEDGKFYEEDAEDAGQLVAFYEVLRLLAAEEIIHF